MPAHYRATLAEFFADDPKRVLGVLIAASGDSGFVELKHRQIKAWQREIEMLRATTASLVAEDSVRTRWSLLLEYPIPRRDSRIDAVLLAGDIIFCIEFKTEDKRHSLQAEQQAEDYALDLRDFHEQSRGRCIVPFAVAAKAPTEAPVAKPEDWADAVRPVWRANPSDLALLLSTAFRAESTATGLVIDGATWDLSAYRRPWRGKNSGWSQCRAQPHAPAGRPSLGRLPLWQRTPCEDCLGRHRARLQATHTARRWRTNGQHVHPKRPLVRPRSDGQT